MVNSINLRFNFGLHAREWISPAASMFIIQKFVYNIENRDEKTLKMLDYFDIYFTPLANPDGYAYSINKDRNWRKNRRKNDDGTYGVDLNRNFEVEWGTKGASNDTKSEVYMGPYAQSEPEIQALDLMAFDISPIYAGLDFHSFGQQILRNWGYKLDLSANEAILKELGDGMAKVMSEGLPEKYSSDLSAGLYPSGGSMDDWMAVRHKMVSYTIELCPANEREGFRLGENKIIMCSKSAYKGIEYFIQFLIKNYEIPPNH